MTESRTARRPDAPSARTAAQESVRDLILSERDKGNVVFMGIEHSLMSANLDSFVRQPADGILYDLNRGEEVSLTFIDEPKWVNDFAVALVIRKLTEICHEQEAALRYIRDECFNGAAADRARECLASHGLDFFIRDADIPVIEWRSGGCRPATDAEVTMWACIREQQAALDRCVNAACLEVVEDFSQVSNAADAARAVLAKWEVK